MSQGKSNWIVGGSYNHLRRMTGEPCALQARIHVWGCTECMTFGWFTWSGRIPKELWEHINDIDDFHEFYTESSCGSLSEVSGNPSIRHHFEGID